MQIKDGILYDVNNEELSADGSFVVPDSITKIGFQAFRKCYKLTSVTIPSSVTSIGEYAFYYCTKLTSVKIGNGIKSIGNGAFNGCTSLASITFPNSIISIGLYAFEDCYSLTSKKANYKAFNLTKNGELKCLRRIYTVGKKSTVRDTLELCRNGIHYCTNFFNLFRYYYGEYGKDFVIGLCKVSDENIGCERGDSKRCARWIVPTKILSREEVIKIMNGD